MQDDPIANIIDAAASNWAQGPAEDSASQVIRAALTRAGYAVVKVERTPGVVHTLPDILELCAMLVSTQIREERINSIEELHGMLATINDGLAMIRAATKEPAPAKPHNPTGPEDRKPTL